MAREMLTIVLGERIILPIDSPGREGDMTRRSRRNEAHEDNNQQQRDQRQRTINLEHILDHAVRSFMLFAPTEASKPTISETYGRD